MYGCMCCESVCAYINRRKTRQPGGGSRRFFIKDTHNAFPRGVGCLSKRLLQEPVS